MFLCVIAKLGMAKEEVQLPEEPWCAIVFNENGILKHRWEGEVTVKLFGGYTKEDSVMIENSIKILNDLCETVTLKYSSEILFDFC